jgi:predicted MPP superfamily phosphohydrolase
MSPLRIAIFVAVLAALLTGVHYYFWIRLVRDPVLPAPWSTVVTYALAGLAVAVVVFGVGSRFTPRDLSRPLAWIAYTWLGTVFVLLVLLGAVDLGRGVVTLVQKLLGEEPLDPERRLFISRALGGGAGLAAVSLAGVGVYNAARRLGVKDVTVPIAKLSERASGYRIVQVSDIHVGPTIGRRFLEDMVRRINRLEPDLVAITGDLVDGRVSELGELLRPLADLRAKDGVFFVTGNHEYYSGASEWVEFLPTVDVRVLRNERVAIGGEHGFDLAGIDDATAHHFDDGHGADLARAVEGRDETRPLVLLAHQPKAIVEAERHGVDLQLSGHTHGGQIFPFNFLVRLQQPYVAGLHEHGRAKIYVSNGTGYWGPPMRIGAPAEITNIALVPA